MRVQPSITQHFFEGGIIAHVSPIAKKAPPDSQKQQAWVVKIYVLSQSGIAAWTNNIFAVI